MKYLLILDNEQSYGDHQEYPVLICTSEIEAENIVNNFNIWYNSAYKFGRQIEDQHISTHIVSDKIREYTKNNPCPIGNDASDEFFIENIIISYIKYTIRIAEIKEPKDI